MLTFTTRLSVTSNLNLMKTIPQLKFYSESRLDPREVQIPVPWGHVSGKWWNHLSRINPPIVALHGWLDNAATFDKLIPHLSSDLSILALDFPGHGKSSPLPQGMSYNVQIYLTMLRRVIKYHDWRKVSLMGHSLGGLTSFLYSGMYNDEVEKLVLLDILTPIPRKATYISQGGEEIDKFLRNEGLGIDTAPLYTFDELTNAVVKSQNGGVNEETAQILLRRGTMKTSKGLYQLSRDVRLKYNFLGLFLWSESEIFEFCHDIKANVLCLKADSYTYYYKKEIFYKFWQAVEKSARKASLKLVPGKHHVHLQDPKNIAQLVNDFLTSEETLHTR